jgi:hypothetical protein
VVNFQRSGQANYQMQLLYIPEREDPTDIAAEPSNHAVTRISKFRFMERTVLHIERTVTHIEGTVPHIERTVPHIERTVPHIERTVLHIIFVICITFAQ